MSMLYDANQRIEKIRKKDKEEERKKTKDKNKKSKGNLNDTPEESNA